MHHVFLKTESHLKSDGHEGKIQEKIDQLEGNDTWNFSADYTGTQDSWLSYTKIIIFQSLFLFMIIYHRLFLTQRLLMVKRTLPEIKPPDLFSYRFTSPSSAPWYEFS